MIKPYAQFAKGGGGAMPQFCLLFYAVLKSWRPKGGAMAQCPPPKYAPAHKQEIIGTVIVLGQQTIAAHKLFNRAG